MDLFKVATIEQVKDIINDNFQFKVQEETIAIEEALDRITSSEIFSQDSLPHFNRSTVDGYAVNSRDTYGASETIPSIMNLNGEILMGMEATQNLDFPGECTYVSTGAMLPDGADGVVMIEYTDLLDQNTVLVKTSVAPLENVVQIGDDVFEGELIINKGQKLNSYHLGLLSGVGIKEVKVYKKPMVGVISTGDEIVAHEKQPRKGEIRDVNSILLSSMVKENFCSVINYGVISDEFNLLRDKVENALKQCDLLLISGGTSVGKKDQTIKVINSIENSKFLIHGVALKPGKPTIIAKVNEKAVFGLPGHPLAAAVVFNRIVKDYIYKGFNYKENKYPLKGEFKINYHKAKGREEFLLVNINNVNGKLEIQPILTKSGIISSIAKAQGYVIIEMNKEGLKEGEIIEVYTL
ncbi:molybdopterin molybdotransferase MoeA [Clostridium grantii]|uniref:Molybdopterin molybdenumtransferase n=1 Tax=Clostridium grantii DSM 8605 TaxID=1121316 RepID=A0A1M5W9K4_9CLOT|nr:molybdopterin molybdotransferase MoeA [Clostridium grantii]SHH84259.1 molybdopterin molybdotransferase [Clostridium grantii DSM 8605]